MRCCNKPKIESSTYTDWCTNCGWSCSYLVDYAETQCDDLIEYETDD